MEKIKEIRTFTGSVEVREKEDKTPEIRGIAAVIDSVTNLGWFEEEIKRGAFDDVLNDDVRVLGNHDPNIILGRTASGTGKVWVDKKGNLAYSFEPDMENPIHVSWVRSIQRGDITQSSFAFEIGEETWGKSEIHGEMGKRSINKISRLWDVSPVTYPAYDDTSVAARSRDKVKNETETTHNVDEDEDFLDEATRRFYKITIGI